MKNKRDIIILIIILVLTTVIIFVSNIYLKNREDNNKINNVYNENSENNDIIYNESELIEKKYSIDSIEFTDISYYYSVPETYISFVATNTGEETITLGYFTITIKDANGKEIVELVPYYGAPLSNGESVELQVSTVGNFVEGYYLEFEKYEQQSIED